MKLVAKNRTLARWDEIENLVSEVHRELWVRRDELWGGNVPGDEVRLLEPGVALRLFGYRAISRDFLGEFEDESGVRTEVAGRLDPVGMTVEISRRFPGPNQLFTAAHELGHALLHAGSLSLHRDRSLDGGAVHRNWMEREADWAGTCFLMPAKLVRRKFLEIFRSAPFQLTDDNAFLFWGCSMDQLLRRFRSKRDLSRAVAEVNTYAGQAIPSLASTFGVSTKAMAIRLEELRLIAPPASQAVAPAFLYRTA